MKPYSQAPHVEGPSKALADAPNAALLIDFDNVTMGMRSDLSKELKSLLQSDIIRGKVTVQRAYADWRRYPQYIVPLSEASVDLIFAPAYGSSKKNATDIRMAIDGLELVFIRPEIGTFILLTGDSDFSSLVLKLKEYGKYVIGVGIQESSSDILVQNCDEYYSYTSLTGLRKATDSVGKPTDPWELVADALTRMTKRSDIMRSDRLKQVMIEIDGNFDEGSYGFSKFSKFLAEASSRGIVKLHKLENGQYEVKVARKGGRAASDKGDRDRKGRGSTSSRRARSDKPRSGRPERSEKIEEPSPSLDDDGADPLRGAYELMLVCLRALKERGRESVRDSDVKRKMLERDSSFDEAELGFGKFSRFLQQAEEHGVVRLERTHTGNYQVSLKEDDAGSDPAQEAGSEEAIDSPGTAEVWSSAEPHGTTDQGSSGRLGPRGGSGRRRDPGGPVLFEGQVVGQSTKGPSRASEEDAVQVGGLGLPAGSAAMISYLTNSYKGVGKKTAEALVEAFGNGLFEVFQNSPHRVSEVVPRRAEQVLAEWRTDYTRRIEGTRRREEASASTPSPEAEPDERGPRGGRRPKAGHQPRSERQRGEAREPKEGRQRGEERGPKEGRHRGEERGPKEGRQPSGEQRQSDPKSEGGRPGEESSSSRVVPRGRGGARRTRRGSRRQSPGSDQEKS